MWLGLSDRFIFFTNGLHRVTNEMNCSDHEGRTVVRKWKWTARLSPISNLVERRESEFFPYILISCICPCGFSYLSTLMMLDRLRMNGVYLLFLGHLFVVRWSWLGAL